LNLLIIIIYIFCIVTNVPMYPPKHQVCNFPKNKDNFFYLVPLRPPPAYFYRKCVFKRYKGTLVTKGSRPA